MANPKKKITHSRKGNRYSKVKLAFVRNFGGLVRCAHCNKLIRAHHICMYCGYYDGKLIVKQEEKKKASA
jgi:large subunit ribosomal protein L32